MVSSRSLTAFLALASCFFCSAALPSPGCRRLAGFVVDIVDGGSRLPQPRSAGWTGQERNARSRMRRCGEKKQQVCYAYPPRSLRKGLWNDRRGISVTNLPFSIFRGARAEARMGDGKIGQNHFGRRAGHSNGSLRRRKVVTTCTSPCTTFLYSIDKRCTGNNSTCPVQCVGVFGDGGQTATLIRYCNLME